MLVGWKLIGDQKLIEGGRPKRPQPLFQTHVDTIDGFVRPLKGLALAYLTCAVGRLLVAVTCRLHKCSSLRLPTKSDDRRALVPSLDGRSRPTLPRTAPRKLIRAFVASVVSRGARKEHLPDGKCPLRRSIPKVPEVARRPVIRGAWLRRARGVMRSTPRDLFVMPQAASAARSSGARR